MATTSNLSSIIRYYAEKQNSPFIDLKEFCLYVKKYAEHHVEEQAELVKYLGDPTNTVTAELQGLTAKHLVSVITANNKKTIVSIGYYASKYTVQYKEILSNFSIPYPIPSDMPKNFPLNALEQKQADEYIPSIIDKDTSKQGFLYVMNFPRELPPIILPASIPVQVLFETAQAKIRKVLKKDEYHDYFLKKLRSTNPTKEISIRNFFDHFVDKNENNYFDFKEDDDYYLWNQLLYFIRQDFEKIQDRTTEDTNILQAISISEIHSSYLKEKFQKEQQRQLAIKQLETGLATPPYFFSMAQILKFQDEHGKSLFNVLSDDDLKEFLTRMTTEGDMSKLPELLVFRVESGTRYYVFKKKIIQVIVRLCNEAHDSIEKNLEQLWYKKLLEYEKLKEMTDDAAFEKVLEEQVQQNSPVLYALLTANFMTLLALEKDNDETMDGFHIFVDNHLLSYSDLLMLRNKKILANARSLLPFIYTIPILSWIISIFRTRKKDKLKAKQKEAELEAKKQEAEESKASKPKNKQAELATCAMDIAKDLIPEGSTIDRELDFLNKQWNKMISKEANMQLTDDVNSLIRDYTRRVVKTLSSQTFTRERLENLAATLVKTPNMQKIKEERALKEYVTLYMLRLVSNSR